VSRSIVADLGITTPKRVAKSIAKYSRQHSDLEFVSLVIPQVPGTIRRSKPVRGTLESVVKAKKYVIVLAIFQPYVAGSFVAAYLIDGQFAPSKKAMIFDFEPHRAVAPTDREDIHDSRNERHGSKGTPHFQNASGRESIRNNRMPKRHRYEHEKHCRDKQMHRHNCRRIWLLDTQATGAVFLKHKWTSTCTIQSVWEPSAR
jgi:hypothetical protein